MHKVFGTKENVEYTDREGAYLILIRDNQVGVVKTPKGFFLLGGGLENGESHIECIERECIEEAGVAVVVKDKICSAETYCRHDIIGYFHPIQTYYIGELVSKVASPIEKDHEFMWIEYDELKGKMYVEMQNWALKQCFKNTYNKYFVLPESIDIKKVDKDTELADKLIRFVEDFSWEDVKEHMIGVLCEWVFTDWETPFVALVNGQIVGMATLMKTDYYPLPEIYPWVSSIFVSETYRGHRISEKLIDFANEYAKKLGFDKTYIPSEHTGLYEKYGYRYLKDIVNYGSGTDRLYVKEIK